MPLDVRRADPFHQIMIHDDVLARGLTAMMEHQHSEGPEPRVPVADVSDDASAEPACERETFRRDVLVEFRRIATGRPLRRFEVVKRRASA